MKLRLFPIGGAVIALLVVSLRAQQPPAAQTPVRPGAEEQGFRFKSGVELINVTATLGTGARN